MKVKEQTRVHCWTGPDEPMAICEGGPADGWVYYETNLQERARAAKRMGTAAEYRRTEKQVPHPVHPEFLCQVWRYQAPGRALSVVPS